MANDKQIITAAARKYGVNPKILWGLYGTETNYGKNKNTSSAGAVGPFQFLPSTAHGMGVDPYDFKSAAYGAAKYLSQYKSRGVGGMLSAYNAGPAGAYQPGYVNTTLQNAKSYGSGGGAPIPGVPQAQGQQSPAEAPQQPPLPTFNKAAYQKASSDAMLGRLLRKTPGSEALTQVLGTREPEKSEFMEEGQPTPPKIVDRGTHSEFAPPTAGAAKAGYPLAKVGKVIGLPYQGTHTLYGNWESDNAIDLAVPKGTPVYATENGTIGSQIGPLAGAGGDPRLLGLRLHLASAGNEWYYAHLSKILVHPGEKVKAGDLLGYSGEANGVQHLHIASKHGNPTSLTKGH